VVEYTRGTSSTVLPDNSVTRTNKGVVESLDDVPAGSPVVALESREAPKVILESR
jgi:hypothetical protein